MDTGKSIQVELWDQDAIVLFDWLMSVDFEKIPVTHPSAKQSLANLLSALEELGFVQSVTTEMVSSAQREVSKDMGW
jgi:hypothetical protein